VSFWNWFTGHVAGGLVTGILVGGGHLVLSRRHTRKTADRQTVHLDAKTDAQTAELKDGNGEGG
jgi:hypothetical protein